MKNKVVLDIVVPYRGYVADCVTQVLKAPEGVRKKISDCNGDVERIFRESEECLDVQVPDEEGLYRFVGKVKTLTRSGAEVMSSVNLPLKEGDILLTGEFLPCKVKVKKVKEKKNEE